MRRVAQTGGGQRRKRIVWSKALFALAPAALFIAAPVPAHAGGECTALAYDDGAYTECMFKMNVHCKATGNAWLNPTVTCTYPDGGRDDCFARIVPFGGGRTSGSTCTYVPPGSEPAPAPEPGSESS